MAADVLGNLYSWSTTAGSNLPAGSTTISTNLDDNLREIQKVVRYTQSRDTIASASTCDLGTKEAMSLDVTGTTTITSFGTVSAGIRKWVTFADALTLTYNATSLKLPGAASITTAAGDKALFESLGSGNWQCLAYQKASGLPVVSSFSASDGTVSVPSINFSSDTDTGFYRIGANSIGIAAGGVQVGAFNHSALTLGANGTGSVTSTFSATSSSSDATVTVSATAGGVVGINTVQLLSSATGLPAYVKVNSITSSSSYGGQVSIKGGDYPAATNGTAGSVTIRAGGHAGTPSNPLQIGGDLSIYGGLGYLSGNMLIASNDTLINTAYPNYGTVSIQAGSTSRSGLKFYQVAGCFYHTGVAPTLTSGGGTGATISGTKNAFEVTAGTSASTTIVVTHQGSAGVVSAPFAIAQTSANRACWCTTTDTQVTINLASAPSSGEKVRVLLAYV